MNRDEQKQIIDLIDRAVKRVQDGTNEPMDVEADAIIRALFVRNPEAAYRVTMLALEQANEIARLQVQLADLRLSQRSGLLSRLFKPGGMHQNSEHIASGQGLHT
jgi:hypothetical protein